MANETMGRVLPFARSAAYLQRLADKQRAQGHLLQALELLRMSRQKEPEMLETTMEMAETYALMRCPALSNRLLFSLLENDENDAACLYGIGCNFAALGLNACAVDCLALYLHQCRDGEYAAEASELLESLTAETEESAVGPEARLSLRMERAVGALERGRPRLAARLLRRALALDRRNAGAHALMSFALLGDGRPREALEAARCAVRCCRQDVRAQCAMAASLAALGSMDPARAFLRRAGECMEDDADFSLVCQTARKMGEHETVIRLLTPLENEAPLSDAILHWMASAHYNAGHAGEAVRRWRTLRRIDPMDTVAEYRLRMAEEGALAVPVSYERQVPLEETLSRLSRLRLWVQEGPESLRARWQENTALEPLLRWGLSCPEEGVPGAMMGVLASLGDARARQALRDVLCDPFCLPEEKHNAVAALHLCGETGPFYAEISGRLARIHVARANEAADTARYQALVRAVRARVGEKAEEAPLQAVCRAVAALPGPMDALFRARAAETALRALWGQPCQLRLARGQWRKIRRCARRILREAGYDALHQL